MAYDLFLSKEFPSWGFEVENGSTSIWERWDSYTKEDGFKYNAAMNSFNHYAFGAVCEWMFGNAAGIQPVEPGFSRFIIRPEIDPKSGAGRLGQLKATYRSINGLIESSWKKEGNGIVMHVTIPANTRAEVYVPAASASQVLVDGKKLSVLPDLKSKESSNGYVVISVGSGSYEIRNNQ